MRNLFILLLLIFNLIVVQAQEVTIFGVVKDADEGLPLSGVKVMQKDGDAYVISDEQGQYSIKVQAASEITLFFTHISYNELEYKVNGLNKSGNRYVNIFMATTTLDLGVTVTAARIDDGGMVREAVSEFKVLPSASGNFESLLPSIALGVSAGSGGELSSQYNVRGGNYDENLVYVNDFEIFRPQLIRAGQQEGLSFPNIDLIRDVSFSSGGFEARYGNKMSSVLDVKYKRPDVFKGSISASLLGASAHIEGSKRLGANAYNKFRYLIGSRYKTNKYLLGSQEVKGEYVPNFTDVQTYLTYDFTKNLQLAFLGNYNTSNFDFIPVERTSTLGLLTNSLRFTTAYEGSEKDKFVHGLTGVSLNYIPQREKNPYFLKLLASRYSGSEQEKFDIIGYYRLSQIESNFSAESFGQEIALLGLGVQHRYARNYLYNQITNAEIKGGIEMGQSKKLNFIEFGAKVQSEYFEDLINEWERIDSAGYSLPYTGKEVAISKVLKTKNILNNTKIDVFLQDEYSITSASNNQIKLNAGVRFSHNQLGDQTFFSPRVAVNYIPASKKSTYRLAWGIYHQAPFYREFRQPNGILNTDQNTQRSMHFVAGLDRDFDWSSVSKKPFRLISEIYYKKFDDLVSYEADNVRISYSGKNDSKGYATGVDVRINGEFVKDAESWVNFSFLSTKEALYGVQHLQRKDTSTIQVDYVPRPTDRLFAASFFFQDYLPKNKNFKVNLNYSFGTGLPFGRKDDNTIYRNTFRYRNYQRLDIGFSYLIWDKTKKQNKPNHWLRRAENAWLSLDVFNLLGVENTASITWIKTITNTQYAINNNLTSRRISLRMRLDF
jgi:hypothetical protein